MQHEQHGFSLSLLFWLRRTHCALVCQAVSMPKEFDKAWEAIGGGPADLVFPEEFLGVWNVQSTLRTLDVPLGPQFCA